MGNDITSNISKWTEDFFLTEATPTEGLILKMTADFPKERISIAFKNVLFRYATASMIRTFSLTCKDFKVFIDTSLVWRTALYMDISAVLAHKLSEVAGTRGVDWKKAYKAALFEKFKSEYYHLSKLKNSMKAVYDYQGCQIAEKGDIVGLVADIVMFDDEDVARCLSLKRPQGANMILMETGESLMRFKESRKYGVSVPYDVAYMTMDSNFSVLAGNATKWCDVKKIEDLPKIRNEPNFVGYAIHLVRLRPEHEYLRSTFLFSVVFMNLMVFRTQKDALEYEERNSGKAIWTVGLDYIRKGYHAKLHYASRTFRPLSHDLRTEDIDVRIAKINKTRIELGGERVASFMRKKFKWKRKEKDSKKK